MMEQTGNRPCHVSRVTMLPRVTCTSTTWMSTLLALFSATMYALVSMMPRTRRMSARGNWARRQWTRMKETILSSALLTLVQGELVLGAASF